jgi:hypothetical protein
MHTEHKTFADKKPQQLVYLELGAGNGGMLLSISEDGFRFRAVTPVRANGSMPFAFALDGTNRLEGSGVVEWVEEDGKSGGLRFTEVSQEFRSALSAWLYADSSSHTTGREVTPASAIPLDTMEKIRQELRAGYPARPVVEPVEESQLAEPKPKIPERDPDPVSAEWESAQVNTERKAYPVTQEQKWPPPLSKRKPEAKEQQISKRIFPLPEPASPQPASPAVVASAFLKSPVTQKPEPEPAAPAPEIQAAAPKFAPFLRATPSTSLPAASKPDAPTFKPLPSRLTEAVPEVPPRLPSASASESSRPFIPAFEESFEYAWEKSKLTAPADSPRVSRAAAAGIIVIALGTILGVLAFNYRQDVGSLMIQLGQVVSGEDHSAVPATAAPTPPAPETKSESNPADQPSTTEKQPPALSPRETTANSANEAKSLPEVKSSPTLSSPKPPAALRDSAVAGKSSPSTESPAPSASAVPVTSLVVPVDSGTGQEEFNAAREILRGSNRQRDFSRALDLLWAGVRKGYVPAEVTLADLFRRGDGLEKNCDQARVLLVAASKKGSSDARLMLEQMAEQGCQ